MARVVITGANGFIGRHLCRRLAYTNLNCLAVSRSPRPEGLSGSIAYQAMDFSSRGSDFGVLASRGDTVIHLANMASAPHTQEEAALCELINHQNTAAFAEAASRCGAKRFIFVSSSKVLGKKSGELAVGEQALAAPADLYAISKCRAEQALLKLQTNSPMEIAILRLPPVYGAFPKKNFLHLLRALDCNMPLPLGKTLRRSLLYVGNLCHFLQQAVEMPSLQGIYHLADGPAPLLAEVCSDIAELLGRKAFLLPAPPALSLAISSRIISSGWPKRLGLALPFFRPEAWWTSFCLDTSKVTALPWQPPYNRREGLAAMVSWYRNLHGHRRFSPLKLWSQSAQ